MIPCIGAEEPGARARSLSTSSQIELRETEQRDSDTLSRVFPYMFDFCQYTDSFKRGKTVYVHVILEFNSDLDGYRSPPRRVTG